MSSSDGHLRFFPYEEPYDHQREAMSNIADALAADRDVLFEGATGTGKTLAALAPALEHAREHDKTVVITTSVHQQTRQFIEEARAITRQEPVRAVVFRGKGSMCHVDVGYEECQVLRDTTRELVEAERELAELEERQGALLEASQAGDDEATADRGAVMEELATQQEEVAELREESTVCDHYYRNLAADTDGFYAWLYDDVRTPEEIYERAERGGFCGYELLKDGMEGVDLVICNYHHVLDPFVREQFFRWIGRDPEDVVAVFDEAHNVESAARDHATRQLAEQTLERALAELDGVEDDRADAAANVVGAFRDALVATYEDAVGPALDDEWTDVPVANESGRDDLTLAFLERYTGPGIREDIERALELGAELDRRYERAYREGETTTRTECQVETVASFVEAWLDEGDAHGQHPMVSVRRGETGPTGRAELYTCIPRSVTEPLFEELSAAVLMSATLRPFDVAADVLGLEDPLTMAYGAQFPEERRRTYAVDVPALFASRRDDPAVQDRVSQVLADAVRFTPGNVLAFFPSYAEAERYHDRFDGTATRYLDRPGTRTEELKQRFVGDDDGVLFTSLWGTLTEGVSFDGDDARTVVVVGVPYPQLDDRSEAVQAAYDDAFGDREGWRYAVEIPTIRRTRQALGRVVRSPTDFGARVLVDERYVAAKRSELREYSVRESFPPEEREELLDVAPEKLRFAMLNFFSDVDAWAGEPPTP